MGEDRANQCFRYETSIKCGPSSRMSVSDEVGIDISDFKLQQQVIPKFGKCLSRLLKSPAMKALSVFLVRNRHALKRSSASFFLLSGCKTNRKNIELTGAVLDQRRNGTPSNQFNLIKNLPARGKKDSLMTDKVLIIQEIVKYLFYGFDMDFLWIELMKDLRLLNLLMTLLMILI